MSKQEYSNLEKYIGEMKSSPEKNSIKMNKLYTNLEKLIKDCTIRKEDEEK